MMLDTGSLLAVKSDEGDSHSPVTCLDDPVSSWSLNHLQEYAGQTAERLSQVYWNICETPWYRFFRLVRWQGHTQDSASKQG